VGDESISIAGEEMTSKWHLKIWIFVVGIAPKSFFKENLKEFEYIFHSF
jgi:hypothetical protein